MKNLLLIISKIPKGGSTIANREARFKNKYNEVPGPGTYSVPSTTMTESKFKFSESKVTD